jgi:hypothetical protein
MRPDPNSKEMRHIKQLAAGLALVLFITSPPARAQARRGIKNVGQLQAAFYDAFGMDRLAELDARYPNHGKFKVIIEYWAGPEESDAGVFGTFGALGQWLKSRETEGGFPWRMDTTLVGCRRGVCTYKLNENLQHNRLYLQKLSYGYRKGRPYLKTVFLLAG